MINPVNLKPKQSGGHGGLWGKIAGGLAAVAAAPFTGGASLSAAPALMAAGSMAGNAIDPAKISNPTPLQTVGEDHPAALMAQLQDATKAAYDLPVKDQAPIVDYLGQAMEAQKKRLGMV